MKITLRSLPAIALAASVLFTACQKEQTTQQPDNTTEVKTHADDQSRVSGDLDDVANDADAALESNPSFGGREQSTLSICNAIAVADTMSNPRTITISYNGNNCQGTALRTGTVVLFDAHRRALENPGAAITATFQNLKVKRLSDNKSITINGSQTITNVSGGLLFNLANLQSIVHTITSGNMSITFDDNSQRTWNVARKRTFTYNNGAVLSIQGIGTSGGVTNAAEWGTNRFGKAFTTSITQPLVIRQDCSFRLTAGEVKHEGFATSTVTFGLNAAGQAISCPGTGNYFMKLVWASPNGASVSAILPY